MLKVLEKEIKNKPMPRIAGQLHVSASCITVTLALASACTPSAKVPQLLSAITQNQSNQVAANLKISTLPNSGTVGSPLGTVVVQMTDASGNLVTTGSDARAAITLSVVSGSGTLLGTDTTQAVSGYATFKNLIFNATGPYTLKASYNSIASPVSNSVSIASCSLVANPSHGPVGTMVDLTGVDFTTGSSMSTNGTTGLSFDHTTTDYLGLVMPNSTTGNITVPTTSWGTCSVAYTVDPTPMATNLQTLTKLVPANKNITGPTSNLIITGISDDGNTIAVGSSGDNSNIGAAWIFSRSGTTWSEQQKIVATDAIGTVNQNPVALSADGNTLVMSSATDNSGIGATWVFTRNAGTWTEQQKIIAPDAIGNAHQAATAMSKDGNTIVISGPNDNTNIGAAWIYTRSGQSWAESTKLVATNAIGAAAMSVSAMSLDGNTVLLTSTTDNGIGATYVFNKNSSGVWTEKAKFANPGSANAGMLGLSGDGNTFAYGDFSDTTGDNGAFWMYRNISGTWSQIGKFSGTGGTAMTYSGESMALSLDGNSIMMSGWKDGANAAGYYQGAIYWFTWNGSTWVQQSRTLPTGQVGTYAQVGLNFALSGDTSVAIVSGNHDNYANGAAWVFQRSGSTWNQKAVLRPTDIVNGGPTPRFGYGYMTPDGTTAVLGSWYDNGGIGAIWVYTQ